VSHDARCRLAHKPGAFGVAPCPECSHDLLCRYRDDVHLAHHDCDLCSLIAMVRAEERDKPINAIPRAICNSEPFMWLMVGSNHTENQLNALRPAWTTLLDAGGGWGQTVRADERGES